MSTMREAMKKQLHLNVERTILSMSLIVKICVVAITAVTLTLTANDDLFGKGKDESGTSGPVVIVVLGSSTAAGSGASTPSRAWVNRYRTFLQRFRHSAQVINLAKGGYTTYKVMPSGTIPPPARPAPDPDRNITKALSFNPNAIIINLPSNDAAGGYSVSEQLANYDVIIATANTQGVPVWISTTQPRNLSVSGRQNLLTMRDSTFARFGNKAIDFWNGIARENGKIHPEFDSGDGTHLNDAGHAILFERAAMKTMEPILSEQILADRPREKSIAKNHSGERVLQFGLHQNFPNPFNPSTTIQFSVATSSSVHMKLFDVTGKEVVTLANETYAPGSHEITFSATGLPSGIYFYRLEARDNSTGARQSKVKRLMLLK